MLLGIDRWWGNQMVMTEYTFEAPPIQHVSTTAPKTKIYIILKTPGTQGRLACRAT